MISSSPRRMTPEARFSLMLAHFAFTTPPQPRPHSVLCRILDGRELDEVCPLDLALLTPEERAHYQATYRGGRALALAVRSRAELRWMLSREIGLPPNKVPIAPDRHGKPRCTYPTAADLDFSVSRAGDCAIIALGEATGVGVDVEEIIDEEPSDENLAIVFNETEFRAWACLPADQRRKAFTQAWTIKEAALKASGMGLDGDTHELTVRFDDHGNAVPILPSSRWIFERLEFCPCYAASFMAVTA
jgi:4'-phosphopantetheinyl transferase